MKLQNKYSEAGYLPMVRITMWCCLVDYILRLELLKLLGNLLEESGWTGALTQVGIASSQTADSFLKALHVTCTCRAHKITVSSLYLLLKKAYS